MLQTNLYKYIYFHLYFSGHEIDVYLSAYFTQASDLVKTTEDPQQLVELCMLVLQCLEVIQYVQ